jgi:hypothetical protein
MPRIVEKAIGYWTIARAFDPSWSGANLALLIWPAPFMKRLVRQLSAGDLG